MKIYTENQKIFLNSSHLLFKYLPNGKQIRYTFSSYITTFYKYFSWQIILKRLFNAECVILCMHDQKANESRRPWFWLLKLMSSSSELELLLLLIQLLLILSFSYVSELVEQTKLKLFSSGLAVFFIFEWCWQFRFVSIDAFS